MNEPIGLLPARRHVCALVLLFLATGCSVWRPLPGAGLAHPESERLGHAKVFLRDGTQLELADATIRLDSIIGFGGDTRARWAVARTEVVGVDASQSDAQRTFVLGALVTVSLTFVYVATVVALLYRYGD